jgi:hypothetical protein
MLYDSSGQLRPARLSALLQVRGGAGLGGRGRGTHGTQRRCPPPPQHASHTHRFNPCRPALPQAALGYVAERSEGFVDLDTLPEEGASAQEVRLWLVPADSPFEPYPSTRAPQPAPQRRARAALGGPETCCPAWPSLKTPPPRPKPPIPPFQKKQVLRFVLSPEARDLRPLLVSWLATGADLILRDRARKALAAVPSLAPRLPFVGALPLPPPPPVPVPGLGLVPLDAAVDLLAPSLDAQEGVYLQSLLELAAGVLGIPAAQLDAPDFGTLFGLFANPGAPARELAAALQSVAGGDGGAAAAAVAGVAADVADAVAETLAARAGVPVDTLFPLRRPVLDRVRAGLGTPAPSAAASVASVGSSMESLLESSLDDDGSGYAGPGPSAPRPRARVAARAAPTAAAAAKAGGGGQAVAMRSLSSMEEEAEAAAGKQQQQQAGAAPVRR